MTQCTYLLIRGSESTWPGQRPDLGQTGEGSLLLLHILVEGGADDLLVVVGDSLHGDHLDALLCRGPDADVLDRRLGLLLGDLVDLGLHDLPSPGHAIPLEQLPPPLGNLVLVGQSAAGH